MASRLLWASRAASRLRISLLQPRPFSSSSSSSSSSGSSSKPEIPRELKYADSHEWVKAEGKSATIGITDHAQDHLGDVVYVELPEVGAAVTQGGSFGAVESVKATSDINSPVSGKVVKINEELNSSPGLVNSSPYDKGWIIKVEISDEGELNNLMGPNDYSEFCEKEDAH